MTICKYCKFSKSLLGSCTWELMDGVKKIKLKAFVELQQITLRVYLFLRHFFTKLNKKRIALICFIEITSFWPMQKRSLIKG